MKKIYPGLSLIAVILFSFSVNAQQHTITYKKIPLLQLKDSAFRCTVIGKQVYLDGDIHLGDTTELNRLQNLFFSVVVDNNFIMQTRWPNSTVPFELDNSLMAWEKNIIIKSLNDIMGTTNIIFKPRTTDNDYILYKKVSVSELGFEGGRSPIGRKGGKQEIIMSSISERIIKHETMHSLGFFHEQSREDRDSQIDILTDNIDPAAINNFDKHYFFASDIGSYDFNSIMHYHHRAFGKLDSNNLPMQTITRKYPLQNDTLFGKTSQLSISDSRAVNTIYPFVRSSSMLSLIDELFSGNESWTTNPYYGSKATFFADVTGDRKADAIVVNDNGITVRRSNGLLFSPNESWTTNSFFGKKGTFFADVTGDGKADAIAININGVLVRRSSGRSFTEAETWTNNFLGATKGTFFADVTGDGKADAIMVETTGVKVFRSDGSSFLAGETWTSIGYFGSKGTYFADVTGDGKADAIVVNDGGVTVRRSTGTAFAPNETWTTNPYFGNVENFFADVTGDGRADAIVVNDWGITVRRSTGNAFMANETGISNPYLADKGIFFADIKGSRKCAAIVVNNSNIVARPAQ